MVKAMLSFQRPTLSRFAIQLHQRAQLRLQRRYLSTQQENYRTGQQIEGFTLRRKKEAHDLELTIYELEHNTTGAEYLHIARNDRNNVFSVGFKTNPQDHTGAPHILEHLVLCGSQRYPVHDPFFKMQPRSFANFMNAMTYPDFTIYPFATTNHQDFRNLRSVYLDATLNPLLRATDFAQEGWRIGPEHPDIPLSAASSGDTSNRLVFKGVVYNEMKGNMSNSDFLFNVKWREKIFPTINNSGGLPQHMTNLTHSELKDFHASCYHPSNAKFFTYGDIPLWQHLKDTNAALEGYSHVSIPQEQRSPVPIDQARQELVYGPVDPLYQKDQQYKSSMSWIMCDTSDVVKTFSLAMISSLLLDGYGAPLYQNTIELGWGASYTPNTGFDPSTRASTFSVGLTGLRNHDVSRLADGVRNTLHQVKRLGFDKGKVEGRLHQIELGIKHKTSNFGLALMERLQESWYNGIDPLLLAVPAETVKSFKEEMKQDGYLEELFKTYWLHDRTLNFTMEPNPAFDADVKAEEADRLEQKISQVRKKYSSVEETYKALEKQEHDLIANQEAARDEDVSCLPSVSVSDIPPKLERKAFANQEISKYGTQLQIYEAPTNGITYIRAIQPLKDLPDDIRIYLPLFCAAVQKIGTKQQTIDELEDAMRLYTGGLSISHFASASPQTLDICEEGISFGGFALDQNVPRMLDLLRLLVHGSDFDAPSSIEKIRTLVKSSANNALSDIGENGTTYALRFAEAGLGNHTRIIEETSGLTQARLMMDLAARDPETPNLEDVISKLKTIQAFVLSPSTCQMRFALTCDKSRTSVNAEVLSKFLESLRPGIPAPSDANLQIPYPSNVKSFFSLPYSVYYTALSLQTVPYVSQSSAPLRVLAELLTHHRMHPTIREKGGAYGGSAYSSSLNGTFGFVSYRDPNPLASLDIMQNAGRWAAHQQWRERDIEEAKMSIFQQLDAPRDVNEEGMQNFLFGLTDDLKETQRHRLLAVTAKDVVQAAEEHLVRGIDQTSNVAAIGKMSDWVAEDQSWTEMPMGHLDSASETGGDAVVFV